MHFSKTRYVTFCQQLLVTACVLATAVAAAGVVNLDIVAPTPDAGSMEPAVTIGDAYVNTAPVTPKVRQVAFHGVDRSQPKRERPTRDGPTARRGVPCREGHRTGHRGRHVEPGRPTVRGPAAGRRTHPQAWPLVDLDRPGVPRRPRPRRLRGGGSPRARRHRAERRRPRAVRPGARLDRHRPRAARHQARGDRPGRGPNEARGAGDRHGDPRPAHRAARRRADGRGRAGLGRRRALARWPSPGSRRSSPARSGAPTRRCASERSSTARSRPLSCTTLSTRTTTPGTGPGDLPRHLCVPREAAAGTTSATTSWSTASAGSGRAATAASPSPSWARTRGTTTRTRSRCRRSATSTMAHPSAPSRRTPAVRLEALAARHRGRRHRGG